MSLLDKYRNILAGYKTAVIDDVKKKIFGDNNVEESEPSKHRPYHTIMVIAEPNSKYPQFDVSKAIALANNSLIQMGLFDNIRFDKAGSYAPSGTILIGDSWQFIKGKVTVLKDMAPGRFHTSIDYFASDNNTTIIETSTTTPPRDGDKSPNHLGLIRLDLVASFGEKDILLSEPKERTREDSIYHLAYIFLHIITHNANVTHAGFDCGVMLASDFLKNVIASVATEKGEIFTIRDLMFGKYAKVTSETSEIALKKIAEAQKLPTMNDIEKAIDEVYDEYGIAQIMKNGNIKDRYLARRICNLPNIVAIKKTFQAGYQRK